MIQTGREPNVSAKPDTYKSWPHSCSINPTNWSSLSVRKTTYIDMWREGKMMSWRNQWIFKKNLWVLCLQNTLHTFSFHCKLAVSPLSVTCLTDSLKNSNQNYLNMIILMMITKIDNELLLKRKEKKRYLFFRIHTHIHTHYYWKMK
jgi:hypothetical protein